MKDFSIIIPHRGNGLGLWATTQSCEDDLSGLSYDYEYIIVTNGEETPPDVLNLLHFLKHSGRLGKHIHSDAALTPPVARQRGAAEAQGKYLFFFDNHCMVGKRYFERALADFEKYQMDMLHSSTIFYTGDGINYHYKMGWAHNFWVAQSSHLAQNSYKPYKLAVGGHGGFVVAKSAWDEVEGYGPESLLSGYGGEEVLFDMKMWMLGKTNYIDPKLIHHHYTGNRGYDRHYTDEYYTNLMVSALVIGGQQWLDTVYTSFTTKAHVRLKPKKNMFDLYEDATLRGAEYAAKLDAAKVIGFDDLLIKFREEQVAV